MEFTKEERRIIKKSGSFLLQKGYCLSETHYTISYTREDIMIIIGIEPYSNVLTMIISFSDNFPYDVGWIATVRKGIVLPLDDHTKTASVLLSYLNNEYHNVTNQQYCKDSLELIRDYIKAHGGRTSDGI